MEELQSYRDQGQELAKGRPLSADLEILRLENSKKLESISIPNRKVEDWKYTNLKSILEKNYLFEKQSDLKISRKDNPNFHQVYFLNGKLQTEISDLDDIELSISPLIDSQTDEVNSILKKKNYYTNDFATILNRSNIATGNVFTVSAKTVIEKPVLIHHYFSGEESQHNINNIYIIEKQAEVQFLEIITGPDNVFLNISTEVVVQENAKFGQHFIQDARYGSLVIKQVNSSISKNAKYENSIFHTGAKTSRANIYIALNDEGANCDVHGLYALHRDQHHDTMSYIHHAAPHTESRQLYKGIMDNESRGVFTGRVRVDKDSQLINAEQLNKNLLLTNKAQANSRPQLEIYADDVKCAHGSTTGQLSEDELFYFETRCVSKEKARQIMARAFAYDVVLKISNLKIRDFIKDHLITKHIVS
jgi:Fe-S cluster assembly protein SufD